MKPLAFLLLLLAGCPAAPSKPQDERRFVITSYDRSGHEVTHADFGSEAARIVITDKFSDMRLFVPVDLVMNHLLQQAESRRRIAPATQSSFVTPKGTPRLTQWNQIESDYGRL